MKRRVRQVLSFVMAVTLSLSVSVLGVSAVTSYTPPSQGMAADNSKYLSGATAAANTVVLSVLGINVTSTDGAGISMNNNDGTWGTTSSNLGIFGSDINDSPDPYVYNYFYNFNSTQSGGNVYSAGDYSKWTATPYTLVWQSNKAGPTGGAKGTVTINVNGVEKTCNPAFFYEPDILLGGTTDGYADELNNYKNDYNKDYNPQVFLGYSMGMGQYCAGGVRADGLGLEYNMFDMCAGVVRLGQTAEALANKIGKQNRYDSGTYEIGVNYDKYDRGLYYYAQSQFANGSLKKINYASSASYDTDARSWAITRGTGRQAQYASGIGNDIFDLLENGYKFSDGTVVAASQINVPGGGPGAPAGPTTGYYLTTAQLIEILNDSGSENAKGVIIGNVTNAADWAELSHAGIRCLSALPTCVYGMAMQTVENGMGIPFYLAYFYYNQNSKMNPGNFIYYWMENFYHVTDNGKMETVVGNMLGSSDLPAGYGGAAIASYNASEIEGMISEGIDYYKNTLEPKYKSEGVASDSALYWKTLDTSVGIGSEVRNTNVDYIVTVSDDGSTDDFGNVLYKFNFEKIVTPAMEAEAKIKEIGEVTAESGEAIAAAREAYDALTDEQKAQVSDEAKAKLEAAEKAFADLQKVNPFTDVAESNFFYDSVLWAVNHDPQITKGTSDTTFSPADACTRGQAVTFLWRAAGAEKVTGVNNPFTDVKEGAYYYDAVLWAYKNGVTSGTTDTTFSPDDTCNRGQIVTFLWRSQGKKSSSASVAFTDVAQKAFYYDAVKWAVEKEVTKGTTDTTFSPNDSCTRGQIVTFLYRALA